MLNLLNEEESIFAEHYVRTGNAADAYRTAYPGEAKNLDSVQQSVRGRALLEKKNMKEWMALHDKSNVELATDVLRKQLLKGHLDGTSVKAAQIILQTKDKDSIRKASERFWQTCVNINAVALMPKEG